MQKNLEPEKIRLSKSARIARRAEKSTGNRQGRRQAKNQIQALMTALQEIDRALIRDVFKQRSLDTHKWQYFTNDYGKLLI